jgi:proteasome lid subunit RPN8/RPN11
MSATGIWSRGSKRRSDVIGNLIVPKALQVQLCEEAHAAFPRECCGLIEGVCEVDRVRAVALHPAANLATCDNRFEIDPTEQFRLMRELRGSVREIVGCYHSHPNGKAEPSAQDLENASEDGFIWLIAAVDAASKDITPAAFVYGNRAFAPVTLTVA